MIIELLRNRYSVRKFQDKKIPDEILRNLLEAGRLSPSGGNEQPWLFGVVTDGDLIKEIAGAAYGQEWIAGAPLLIILCIRIIEDDRGAREIQKKRFPDHADAIDAMDKDLYTALNLEEHQTKIAGAHMALVALEHGIGSTWVSHFEVKKVAELLKLSNQYVPSEILVLGYPAEESTCAPRKELQELIFYDTAD
ncbi:MAG: nitroreductase family protein [Planctomycetota bacterium]|nr:MAG: nitroreductase family protein [Planctomycetota bacterium]